MNHGQPKTKNMGQDSNQQRRVLQSKAIQRWCFRENKHLRGFLLFYTVLTHLLQQLFQNSFHAEKRIHPPNKNTEGCFHLVSKGESLYRKDWHPLIVFPNTSGQILDQVVHKYLPKELI